MLDLHDPLLATQVAEWVASLGTQMQAAEKSNIPYATLQRMLKGKAKFTVERITRIAEAAGGDLTPFQMSNRQIQHQNDLPQPAPSIISVPAVKVTASAGGGSLAITEELAQGPFYFAEEWLRRSFGSIAALRLIQVHGSSQEPDLREGDWVMIDQSRTAVEDGLSVLRLDGAVLIKRLQRDGHILHLVSRNPEFVPTTLDLRKDEERVKVIGKVVFSFKSN